METERDQSLDRRNAFDVLMAAAREGVLPQCIDTQCIEPQELKELCSDQLLYKDILGMFI